MPFTITQGTMVHFMTVSLTLCLGWNQLMIRKSLPLLVMPMLITLSGCSQFLLLIDMCVMLLIFTICADVSSWCSVQLTLLVIDSISDGRCPWHSRCCRWYSTRHFRSVFCQLCASCWAVSARIQCQKYCLSKASYQLGQCLQCSQELYMDHHFEVCWSISRVRSSCRWGHW